MSFCCIKQTSQGKSAYAGLLGFKTCQPVRGHKLTVLIRFITSSRRLLNVKCAAMLSCWRLYFPVVDGFITGVTSLLSRADVNVEGGKCFATGSVLYVRLTSACSVFLSCRDVPSWSVSGQTRAFFKGLVSAKLKPIKCWFFLCSTATVRFNPSAGLL